MANFGHVRTHTTTIDGETITFRSKLEYRYAVYLQTLKEAGHIQAWEYEPPGMAIEFEHGRRNNVHGYLPDFAVLPNDTELWEMHETKGYFTPIDAKKIKAFAEQNGNPVTLIFGSLKNTKSQGKQYRIAKKLAPHIHRIIWDASKSLFEPIKFMFDV